MQKPENKFNFIIQIPILLAVCVDILHKCWFHDKFFVNGNPWKFGTILKAYGM